MRFLTLLFACLLVAGLYAQPNTPTPPAATPPKPATDHSYKPLTLKLNDDGSKYVRFIMWHQFWATYTQNNTGTLDANGQEIKSSSDIALRRSRFLAYAQISPRFLILTHWGINNQSFATGGSANGGNQTAIASNSGKKPQLFIHDAWTEFEVAKDKLYIGAGLHYWNGISRLTSHSTLNFMTMDAPIFNWPTIETYDQFARQYGIYAKGQLGRLDYRLSLNKGFVVGIPNTEAAFRAGATAAAPTVSRGVSREAFSEKWVYAGYLNWMFWDKENNKLPFFVGSYLGGKKVFNLGAGFYSQAEATGTLDWSGPDTARVYRFQKNDVNLFGFDAYLDMPLGSKKNGLCLSILGTLYLYDFGPNYLRNIGILNLHTSSNSEKATLAAGGNAQPTIGTGTIGYLQAGLGLPKMKNGTQFMPYFTVTYKDFERLEESSLQYDLGLNYFIVGHHAKITLQYSSRPEYDRVSLKRKGSKGELILQTHIFL